MCRSGACIYKKEVAIQPSENTVKYENIQIWTFKCSLLHRERRNEGQEARTSSMDLAPEVMDITGCRGFGRSEGPVGRLTVLEMLYLYDCYRLTLI